MGLDISIRHKIAHYFWLWLCVILVASTMGFVYSHLEYHALRVHGFIMEDR